MSWVFWMSRLRAVMAFMKKSSNEDRIIQTLPFPAALEARNILLLQSENGTGRTSLSYRQHSGAATRSAPRHTGLSGGRREARWRRRRPRQLADPGGEDAPSTTEMESLGKVIEEIHTQWGIHCKFNDFNTAIRRLLMLNAIDRPVDVLHSECWGMCTTALAEDVIASGSSKCLKSWGKVKQALTKALEEQETWKAAQQCLRAIPKLGVGAATQTVVTDNLASSHSLLDTNNPSLSRPSSPLPTSDPKPNPNPLPQRDSSPFSNAGTNDINESEMKIRPPPYAPQNGAEGEREGRGQRLIPATDMRGQDQGEGGVVSNWEGRPEAYQRASQSHVSLYGQEAPRKKAE
ncbi:uncharacterized protein LOC130266708 [Oenanthe melanoleuca]|uniref:uncharacterized protein LOC130266708 n=1 Tax=Oenanthe melanoleuca TaxID=2939378 RepID=UPI0024C183AA|nr:uncharacterized protein LOC130266708 [Oenanthe melanoleuca]